MTATPILYDPDCGFCRVCVAALLRWDREGRLRPVALGSEEAGRLLAGMPEEQQMASWHLIRAGCATESPENGQILTHPGLWSGGAALSPLFRLLPGGGPLARLADRFPRAADRGYRWVAGHRSAFGKPLPEAAERWADRVISESRPSGR
jgi:predicted DCC family thiol-disulfide oxidoreductase YuxK